jgi:hypothetical protein
MSIRFRNIFHPEIIVYILLWAVLFMTPAISIYIQQGETVGTFPWHRLFDVWKEFGILLAAFLIHNNFLAPLIVHKQHYWQYLGCVAVMMAAFMVMQCANRPEHGLHAKKDRREMHHRPMDTPPEAHDWHGEGEPPMLPDHDFGPRPKSDGRPPFLFSEHDAILTIMLFLMLGMNLGVKFFFRQRESQRRLALLEKENLEQQLTYLRYQINPHFLMNTLNNIHALVDIDAEKAKQTIVELSHIMRFALYDGAKQMVPLRLDLGFLESYIRLMQLRYTDKVTITVDIPDDLPPCELPPMLFITFVENAFKHGVSYQQQSFVEVSFRVTGKHLHFTCRNSKAPVRPNAGEGGVGLQNVRRRLDLIYGKDYVLDISDGETVYTVSLMLPVG